MSRRPATNRTSKPVRTRTAARRGRAASRARFSSRFGAAVRAGAAPLTIALPKGRLAEQLASILRRALGVDPVRAFARTRRLAVDEASLGLRFLSLRAADVPTYVEHGAADVGVAGLDVLREEERDLYEPLRLPVGQCRLVVAGRTGARPPPPGVPLKIATKYPRLAAAHFARQGVAAEIVPLHGSIEIAPVLALADRIVDLVDTGETLRANGLSVLEEVLACSAVVVVNRVSLKLHPERIRALLRALHDAAVR